MKYFEHLDISLCHKCFDNNWSHFELNVHLQIISNLTLCSIIKHLPSNAALLCCIYLVFKPITNMFLNDALNMYHLCINHSFTFFLCISHYCIGRVFYLGLCDKSNLSMTAMMSSQAKSMTSVAFVNLKQISFLNIFTVMLMICIKHNGVWWKTDLWWSVTNHVKWEFL